MCASKQKVNTINLNNPMSYSQQNKWHEQTDINLKKMQSVGYIRPLQCSTITQRQKRLDKDWQKLQNPIDNKPKEKSFVHSIDKCYAHLFPYFYIYNNNKCKRNKIIKGNVNHF